MIRSTGAWAAGSAEWSGRLRSKLSRLRATHAERSGWRSQRLSPRDDIPTDRYYNSIITCGRECPVRSHL
jgi:hypothetical protein